MSSGSINDLITAVIDGEDVDWPAARSHLSTSHDQGIATELQTLRALTGAYVNPPPGEANRRIPTLLESVRILSICCIVVGAAGELYAYVRISRYAISLTELACFVAAALLLDLGGHDRRTRALAACYWTVAASFASAGIRYVARETDFAAMVVMGALRPEAFFAAYLWQFARDFPVLIRFSRLDALCSAALRVTLVVGVMLFVVNVWPALFSSPIPPWMSMLQRFPGNGPWFWNIVFAGAAAALVTIACRARLATSDDQRRVRLFLYSIVFLFGPVILEVIAEGVFPRFGRLMNTPRWRWWGGWIVYPLQLAIPMATTYAVLVGNVLAVRLVIHRAARYLLARALIVWGAAVPLAILLVYVYVYRDQPLSLALASPRARLLIAFQLVAVLLVVARPRLVRALDRWALPGIEDPSVVLAVMAERLKHTRTPLEVTVVLARAAERALQAPAEGYLVSDGRLTPVQAVDSPVPKHSLATILVEGVRGPCLVSARDKSSYYALLPAPDRAWITEQGVAILVPLFAGRGQGALLGLIALKSRQNALAFSTDDMRFLTAASGAASLACDVLHAEERPASGASRVPAEEVAVQCVRCDRVETFHLAVAACHCGGSWEPAALPKRLAGGFDITRKLGAGGMGVVYQATDLTLGREVAIKTLTRLSRDAAARLLVEARTMAGLSHSNIAVLFGTEVWKETPMLVIEYLSRGTLATRLQSGPLPLREAVELVRVLALALDHVHHAGLYHGDIKPSNVGFSHHGVAKFLDFGLARAIGPDTAATGEAAGESRRGPVGGTFPYLSPEVRAGAAPGPQLDIWALSVLFCESVLGTHPFAAARTSAEIRSGVARAADTLSAAANREVAAFVSSTLSTSPNRSPNTAAGFVAALNALAVHLS